MKFFRKGMSFLLAALLVLALLPASAFATDNESVLTSIGHTDATHVVPLSGTIRTAVLTVSICVCGSFHRSRNRPHDRL